MKRTMKIVSLCLGLLVLLTALASCSPSMDDVAGTYSGSYNYNGSKYNVVIILYEDGTYAQATAKNGSLSSTESGDFEIKGNKILCYDSGSHGEWTEYKYSKDTLKNGNHTFKKDAE